MIIFPLLRLRKSPVAVFLVAVLDCILAAIAVLAGFTALAAALFYFYKNVIFKIP